LKLIVTKRQSVFPF